MRRALSAILCCAALTTALLTPAPPAGARSGPVELGAAVNSEAFTTDPDPRYRATLASYDAVTAESAMKIADLEPQRGHFEFGLADSIVAFAEAHHQKVHGHTLTWCEDTWLPSWLLDRSWTKAQLLSVLDNYITTVMTHFRGHVSSWDVVNEAFNADGTLRDCLWSRVIGSDWVEQAFQLAHSADPGALLFYNEVRAEVPNPKFEAMFAMLRDFRERGVPIDGVGAQMHLTGSAPPQDQIEDAIRRLGELGLSVHISELDVPTWYLGHTLEEKLTRQADAYRIVAAACEAQPACFRVTTWGFTDRYSWRGASSLALPFDADYQPKPAWMALQETLRPAPPAEPPIAPSAPPPTAAVAVAEPSPVEAGQPPALSARLRRQRIATWLRRGWLPVALALHEGGPVHAELIARLRGRVIGHAALDLPQGAARIARLRLGADARRALRRTGGSRLVVEAVATDAAGRQADVRARSHLR